MPICAVIAEPARAVTMRAEKTGPQLGNQRQRHELPEQGLGAEPGQHVKALQAQDHAGEGAGQGNDQHGARPDEVYLLHDEAPLERRRDDKPEHLSNKKCGSSEGGEPREGDTTELG